MASYAKIARMKNSSQKFPWFKVKGDVPSLMQKLDWSACAIGTPETWSQQLHTVIGLALQSRSPAAVIWGQGLTTLYNDAYAMQLGNKHPASLGKSFSSIWSEIWPEIGPVIDDAMAGKSSYFEDVPYTVAPTGVPTRRWYTSSFSPVTDSDGTVVGIYITANETTRRMQAERRYAFQSELTERLRYQNTADEITAAASELLGKYLGVGGVVYAAVDESGEILNMEPDWANGDSQSLAGAVLRLDDFGPLVGTTLRAGTDLVVNDVTIDERSAAYADAYAAKGVRSFVSIPLTKAGRLRAILNLHDSHPHYWTEHEIVLAQDMVDRTWSAVENARSQAELRAERDQSQYIFDSMVEGFGLIDRHWTIIKMNAAGLRMVQRPESEVIGRNHWEVFPDTLGTDIEMACRTAKETGASQAVEYRYTLPGGRVVLVETSIYSTREGGLAVFFRDITARREAESRLKDTANRLKFTLESAKIGDWDLDLVNDTSYRALLHDQCFGYNEPIPDWGFETFIRHVHPEDREWVEKQFRAALTELTDWHFECRVVWPDQTVHWIAAHGSIYFVDGKPSRMGGIVLDITERKRAEEALRKEAQRKDHFLAMLAHELRNPLAPISAAAQLLQMAKHDEARVRHTSQIIGRQAGHMTHLIDDLLDVSRVTRGLVELEKAPVDIRHIITDAVEQGTPLMQSRRHHLALHLPPDSTMVMGDKKRLVQVLANVLNNAAKYTDEGGSITLKTDVRESHVIIEVVDNGIGMAPELAARAFDLFAQAERSSDRSLGGLGLGLSLVKSLVELHGGTVTCESEGVGKGSKFTVFLPRLFAEELPAERQSTDNDIQQKADSLRVMVVDDNVDAAAMLTMLLEAFGHEVLVEHGASGALERAKEAAPQVCLLDIGLPEMDGNELAKRLRAQPQTAKSVLIAVTGYGQESDRKHTTAAGFDHHLVKPVDTRKLASILAGIKKI